MLLDASHHPVVVTVEDGLRDGGAGAAAADGIADLAACEPAPDGFPPRVVVLGLPTRFIPQGRPDDLLADLGLDGPGIAAAAIHAHEARPAPDRVRDQPPTV
jgi:1-deoxy-D-xylulose-5-phosphate synthase